MLKVSHRLSELSDKFLAVEIPLCLRDWVEGVSKASKI